MRMKYPKIQTVFKRDPETNFKTLLHGEYSTPELRFLADCEWGFTEKVDGTNIRVEWEVDRPVPVQFGGRTDSAQMPVFLYSKMAEIFTEGAFKSAFDDPEWVMLFGEGYGAKIQKGGGNYIPDGCGFILFDVVVSGVWLTRESVVDIADKMGIPVVPLIGRGSLPALVEAGSIGAYSQVALTPNYPAEGYVARPSIPLLDRNRVPIMTKIKHKDFDHATG